MAVSIVGTSANYRPMTIVPPPLLLEPARISMVATYIEHKGLPAVIDQLGCVVDKHFGPVFPARLDHHVLDTNVRYWSPPAYSQRKTKE